MNIFYRKSLGEGEAMTNRTEPGAGVPSLDGRPLRETQWFVSRRSWFWAPAHAFGAAIFWCLAWAGAGAQTAQPSALEPVVITALGDSLTAGFGLPEDAAFPKVLERRLTKMGFAVKIANAGVSGDTASGGLERLAWSTPPETQIVIVELGANDMLRAIDPKITRAALDKIMETLRGRKIFPVLAGMRALTNWGTAYAKEFEAIYPDLAQKYDAPLYPFFLEGVSGDKTMTLPDGLHPNARGVEKIVDGFAPFLAKVLSEKFPNFSEAQKKLEK